MIIPEHAKLIPVSGNNDSPDLPNAVEVQFNPSTLKVSLSNTLKENPRNGNSRSAQYVDKSSSSLTVELLFDTTYIDKSEEDAYRGRAGLEGRDLARIEAGSDVRLLTKRIAEKFIKPVESGKKLLAPKRCLFQWGAFEFLGLVQSFEETLDFFAPEGVPLRATVALKLSEDRYQFRSRAMAKANRDTPTLSPTGAGSGTDGLPNPDQTGPPVPGGSGDEAGNWRDTAMYNGLESPRLPSASVLAVPQVSAGATVGLSAGFGASASAGFGVGPSLSASATASGGLSMAGGLSASAGFAAPGFSFGASRRLGTGIAGAFPVVVAGSGGTLSAASLFQGSAVLRAGPAAVTGAATFRGGPANPDAAVRATATAGPGGVVARASVGFD